MEWTTDVERLEQTWAGGRWGETILMMTFMELQVDNIEDKTLGDHDFYQNLLEIKKEQMTACIRLTVMKTDFSKMSSLTQFSITSMASWL